MLFKRKNTVKVDMTDLETEKENLAQYLLAEQKLESALTREGLEVNIDGVEGMSAQGLVRLVNKFIYRKHLNSTHWVVLEGNAVKIKKFKHDKKEKKNKNPVTPSTIRHGW